MRAGAWLSAAVSCRPLSIQGLLASAGTQRSPLPPITATGQQILSLPGTLEDVLLEGW